MLLTPGIDLKPITSGADYAFVLDRSGSMSGNKIRTLCEGVVRTLGTLRPEDRFRIITFDSSASDFTRGWVSATPENVRKWSRKLSSLTPGGSTNLYDAMKMALRRLDEDRVTSIVLVTDGVTNTGVVSPKAFYQLMRSADVRVFGFLMGNSANWPLMRTICDASGGFYEGVSNQDDLLGKLLLAKSKIAFESLHDVSVKISGVPVFDLTGESIRKLYRGQQLAIFGRYRNGGPAEVSLTVKLSGRRRTYRCRVDFPGSDPDNPELERLWAMSRIEMFEDLANAGLTPKEEAASAIRDLGIQYQLVTDETSMLVLSDEAFESYGIKRSNRTRIAEEHAAQSRRRNAPIRNYRADVPRGESGESLFPGSAPRLGGGAVSPFLLLLAVLLAVTGRRFRRRKAQCREREMRTGTDEIRFPALPSQGNGFLLPGRTGREGEMKKNSGEARSSAADLCRGRDPDAVSGAGAGFGDAYGVSGGLDAAVPVFYGAFCPFYSGALVFRCGDVSASRPAGLPGGETGISAADSGLLVFRFLCACGSSAGSWTAIGGFRGSTAHCSDGSPCGLFRGKEGSCCCFWRASV